MSRPHDPARTTESTSQGPSAGSATLRLGALVTAFAAVSVTLHLSGWNGPERLQDVVASAGWAGVLVFVLGYAALVLVPTPASLLTILGGVLFGVWWGAVLSWTGAVLGALGGWLIGRRAGRPAVDRLLGGRLREADELLSRNGLVAVLTVRLVPLFPFTPVNYACGLVGVRWRDYVVGTGLGIVPGAVAYASLGASGADPWGIVVGVGALVVLAVVGGTVGRRFLLRGPVGAQPAAVDDPLQEQA